MLGLKSLDSKAHVSPIINASDLIWPQGVLLAAKGIRTQLSTTHEEGSFVISIDILIAMTFSQYMRFHRFYQAATRL